MDMFRDLNRMLDTDKEVFFSFKDDEIFHFLGIVARAIEVDEFFKFASVDSKTHRIGNYDDYNGNKVLKEYTPH